MNDDPRDIKATPQGGVFDGFDEPRLTAPPRNLSGDGGVVRDPANELNRTLTQYSDYAVQMGHSYSQLLIHGWNYWQRMADGAAAAARARPAEARSSATSAYPVTIDQPVIPIDYIDSIPLASKRAKLSSGDEVVVPFRFWRTQALRLKGKANLAKISEILAPNGEKAIPDRNGDAQVHIFAPNYAGTSLGPIPAVFASIVVYDNHFCGPEHRGDGGCLNGEFFWIYRTSNALNDRFKREIWGIHSELAVIAFDYIGQAKGVSLMQAGEMALRLIWRNHQGWSDQVALPGEQRFTSVTPLPLRSHYRTRFSGSALRANPNTQEEAPFDTRYDEVGWDPKTSFGAQLQHVEFTPLSWTFFSDYGGVVEIPPPA